MLLCNDDLFYETKPYYKFSVIELFYLSIPTEVFGKRASIPGLRVRQES